MSRMNTIFHFFMFMLIPVFCFATEIQKEIILPYVTIDPDAQIKKNIFTEQLRQIAIPINVQHSHPILGLAPLGGSKITPFKELDLDGLVIVDWIRPGTPGKIDITFEDANAQGELAVALAEALNGGGNSTVNLMQVSVAAQILARLWFELRVDTVNVHWYLPKHVSIEHKKIELWDGDFVSDTDIPLVTRFTFNYLGRAREIIFVSSTITDDNTSFRSALPVCTLNQLAPYLFDWAYISADGLIFFSKKNDNGASKANRELLSLLNAQGAIVLEYPFAHVYTECLDIEVYHGFHSMCGREYLEKWNLNLKAKIPVYNETVFGYAGFSEQDEVRVYQKNIEKNLKSVANTNAIFSFNEFEQVGEEYIFKISPPPPMFTEQHKSNSVVYRSP